MKKIIIIGLTFFMLIGSSFAETLYTLSDVQHAIFRSTPEQLTYGYGIDVELTGEIVEIIDTGSWEIARIKADNGQVAYIFGYDEPCFLVRLADDYSVGESVSVQGSVNAMYSSYLIPFIGSAKVRRVQP